MLFTLFEESSITPLLGGGVIYPVEGEVKYSFAGWQGSICRVAICPRLRPDIPFVLAAWSIFWIFSFSFSLIFARKCIFQGIFSHIPFFLLFPQQLYCLLVFLLSFCRTCRRLPPRVICAVPVENVWYSNCYRTNSSVKKYVLHYKGLLKYWRSKGIVLTLPCDSLLISEYLSYLQDAKNSYAVLSLAFSALKWVHDIILQGPLGNTVDTTFSRNIIEASKRLFGTPIKKKEPVTPDMIYCICLVFARLDSNLKDLRSALLFVLGFHDLFRISELLDLQAKNMYVKLRAFFPSFYALVLCCHIAWHILLV